MPDLWMDVDAALSEVPVNIYPLTDDSDFKSIEAAIAYNAAGMALYWHFVTCAGAYSVTAVTPTTGGNYDWNDQGDAGIYTIEIPASGGASINNDTEGVGWFTGACTGVLPWRGPTIGFRRAALNDLLIEGSTASNNFEDMFDGTGYAGGTAKLAVDLSKIVGRTVNDPGGAVTVGTNIAQTGADSDTLKSLSDQIDGLTADAGSGARTVEVTVSCGVDPLEDVHVRLTKGATSLALMSDASGVATFYCDDGTWTLALSLAGYTYTATTHVVDGNESIAVAMSVVAITPAAEPDQTNAYCYTLDAHGDIEGSVTLEFGLLVPPDGTALAHDAGSFTVTSHAVTGLVEVTLMRLATYYCQRGTRHEIFRTTDTSTYALPTVL